MAQIHDNVANFKNLLKLVELEAQLLQEQGVILNFNIASDQKTVDVKATTIFTISCKATINQEL